MLTFNEPKLIIRFFLTLISLLIVCVITMTIIFEINHGKYEELSIERSVSGKIIELEYYKGTPEFLLSDGNYYYVIWAVNYDYTPNELETFIQVGDSLFKQQNNKELLIYRNNKEYRFLLLEFIGKEPK